MQEFEADGAARIKRGFRMSPFGVLCLAGAVPESSLIESMLAWTLQASRPVPKASEPGIHALGDSTC